MSNFHEAAIRLERPGGARRRSVHQRKRANPKVIQSRLTGLNPELGDRVPLRLMRENDLETVAPEIMGAVRAFLVDG